MNIQDIKKEIEEIASDAQNGKEEIPSEPISPIKLDCKNIREERQNINIKKVMELINKKDKNNLMKESKSKKICNTNELKRVLKELNLTIDDLLKECTNQNFAKLLAGRIAIKSSRQGSKDEQLIFNTCNKISKLAGITISNLSCNAYRPHKNGLILSENEVIEKNDNKSEYLKSLDGKLSGKVNGWIFSKIVYGSGGHQDNVFREANEFGNWVLQYGKKEDLYVILIDTNLDDKFMELKKIFMELKNLLIVNHVEFQQYFIDNYLI